MTELKLVYALVRGQYLELVIEHSETGARAEVSGDVIDVTGDPEVSLAARVHVLGRARELTTSGPDVLPVAPGDAP